MTKIVRTFHEGGQRLTLRDTGVHHELVIGHVPILSSASLATERAFGALARGESPRVIIGGLGFGATLSAVLRVVGPDAEVMVVEKLTTVVDLMRGDLAHLAPGVLDDPRVRLLREDVAAVIARERGIDTILLDVDNGPEWASFRRNARLYTQEGITHAKEALGPGGVFAVWSGYAVDGFIAQLRRAGLIASTVPLRERGVVRARAYVGRKKHKE